MSSIEEQNTRLAAQMEALATELTVAAQAVPSNCSSAAFHQNAENVINSAEALIQNMKQPMAQLMDVMVILAKFSALRLYIKWDLFAKIPSDGSISYKELGDSIGADTALVARLGAALVASKVLNETEPGKVTLPAQSGEFTSPKSPMSSLVCLGFDMHLKTMAQLPAYFDKFGLREPTGKLNTVFAYAAGDASLTVWDHTTRNPEHMENMMIAMAAMASKTPTVGGYSFDWVVSKAAESPDRSLVVDVGAGKGHALQAIYDATPGLDITRCVVEDLQAVVDEAKSSATGVLRGAQFVSLDFHSEQPIKGALVYYIRRCLHDYGDDDCVGILTRISDAMEPDSRLLIVEQVLENPPSAVSIANDIFMGLIGGKERNLEGFGAILARAGLEVVKVFRTEGTEYAVVECERV